MHFVHCARGNMAQVGDSLQRVFAGFEMLEIRMGDQYGGSISIRKDRTLIAIANTTI